MALKNISFSNSIIKLYRTLIPDKIDIGVIYMYSILAGLVQLSLPLGIQSIINFVMAGSISTSIIVLIGLVVFGVFINGLLQVQQLQILEKIKQKLFVRYSLEYGERIPKLNIEKLDGEYLPEMANKFFDNISLQKALDKLLIDLPAALIQVLLGLSLLAFYHPVFIGFGIILLFIVFSYIRFTSSQGLNTAIAASGYKYDTAAWLQEIARTIKSFKFSKNTALHIYKTDKIVSSYLKSRTSHFRILLSQYWSLIYFKVIITAAMLIVGAYLLLEQQINVGQFIAADIVIISIIGSIEKLISNLDTVYDALVSVEKLSILAEAEKEQSGTITLPPTPQGLEVSFNNINFCYSDGELVLRNLNFSVAKGEIILLKGEAGAGKSTVLRLLTGAFKNYEGSILINCIPIANYDLQSLRQSIGILLGNQDIFEGSIMQNLTMGNEKIVFENILELTNILGLDQYINSRKEGFDTILTPIGSNLPKAVRKNILLMRALLGDNRLILLKEPFDHLNKDQINETFNYIRRSRATVIIASRMGNIKEYFDKVFRMENGTIPVK